MTIADIERLFESWAPSWTAWERDNVGLQVGDPARSLRSVLVALDVTDEIVDEAAARRADLIVSHHPLLFHRPRSITTSDAAGRLVLRLAERKIALYSAHTNLDFTVGGVSFALARALGLSGVRFLSPLKDSLAKIAVFVPNDHVDRVADAMASAGAGVIGEYTSCSFRLRGTGTFRGSASSQPYVGTPGKLEQVEEVRLEMLAPRAAVEAIVRAMKSAHPYEEVAYDVYHVENPSPNFGMGAVGELPTAMPLRSFLAHVKRRLGAEGIRYGGRPSMRIRRVAVCGGSGSDLLDDAIAAAADAFVTADVRYHTYHATEGRIALIDAGHWETERPILEPIAERLRAEARSRRERLKVMVTRVSTNPIHCL